jgi:flagellar basal-body rod modification protein FlgD
MFSVTNKSGPYTPPPVDVNPAFEEAAKQRGSNNQGFKFENVIQDSNSAIAEQMEEDKKAVASGGELKIGESKNDKEFREMLERVTGRKQDKLKNKLDKDDYLNLMVTQLKYQDPTKPMENHEMATQLAQFNTVEQLINVNKSLTDMANKGAQANVDRLNPYLGKIVEVSGSQLNVGSDQTITKGALDLPAPAGSVGVIIKDGTGTIVRTLGLGEKTAGRHLIEWDGKTDGGIAAKAGQYTFEIKASSIDGKEMKAKTSFITKVNAITDLASGGKLETSAGAVEAKDILAIRPDDQTTAKETPAPKSKPTVEESVKATAAPIQEKPKAAVSKSDENNSINSGTAQEKSKPSAANTGKVETTNVKHERKGKA